MWWIVCTHKAMSSHSCAASELFMSAFVSIPKDSKKSLNESNNYRSIALSSVTGKVLDNIVLTQHASILHTSVLQFGFKPNHSTSQCTFVLLEVKGYYVRCNSSCYAILLDASKACDRVQYMKLFWLPVKRQLCPLSAKLLLRRNSWRSCRGLISRPEAWLSSQRSRS